MAKIEICVIILSLLLKIRTNIHITNTHNIQIKQTCALFSGTIGIFSRNIQEIELTNIKIKHYRLISFKAAALFFLSKVASYFFFVCCVSIK